MGPLGTDIFLLTAVWWLISTSQYQLLKRIVNFERLGHLRHHQTSFCVIRVQLVYFTEKPWMPFVVKSRSDGLLKRSRAGQFNAHVKRSQLENYLLYCVSSSKLRRHDWPFNEEIVSFYNSSIPDWVSSIDWLFDWLIVYFYSSIERCSIGWAPQAAIWLEQRTWHQVSLFLKDTHRRCFAV